MALETTIDDLGQMALETTIDDLGIDLLQNIVSRLPALSFDSAACVSRSWNHVCGQIRSRPKLSSACSFNPSLYVAVREVVNKVLLEPVRPHFAIAYVVCYSNLKEAHQLFTLKLGSKVPLVTISCRGIMGRDATSNEFKEAYDAFYLNPWYACEGDARNGVMLTVGFVPGLKVKPIPLLYHVPNQHVLMLDQFITDIREFSTSISGRQSPAAIMFFSERDGGSNLVMESMDYAMSPETVIVGDRYCSFEHTSTLSRNVVGVALVFVEDTNKPPGMGKTQFHAILSSGLLPIGPTFKVLSAKDKFPSTWVTAGREGPYENLDDGRNSNPAFEEETELPFFYLGITRKRKGLVGQEKVGLMTSLSFHLVLRANQKSLLVSGTGIKRGDAFRVYVLDSATALSCVANVSKHMRSFKQGSTTGGDKREVFGGLIFTSFLRGEQISCHPNIDWSPFLDNFPGVTLSGSLCGREMGRGDLNPYVKESEEEKSVRCSVHEGSAVYLVMSYTP